MTLLHIHYSGKSNQITLLWTDYINLFEIYSINLCASINLFEYILVSDYKGR